MACADVPLLEALARSPLMFSMVYIGHERFFGKCPAY